MPCNAIATTTARVADQAIMDALTTAQRVDTIQAFLQAAYPDLRSTVGHSYGGYVNITLGPMRAVLEPSGVFRASGSYYSTPREREVMRALPDQLTELLKRAGGLAVQRRIRQAIAQRYPILEESRTGDAVVLRIEC